MSHDDFEFEPIRGLPAQLPVGEQLLWQGSPRWQSLAVRAYHVRKVAIYFFVLILWRIAVGIHDGHASAAIFTSCAFLLVMAGVAIGVLSLLAFLNARSTVYSITTRRVLLRHGVAVPLTMNIPFNSVESADLRNFGDGTGEIALAVPREQRVGYLITWPHVRPGQITRPAPCFRGLPDAANVAALLSAALAADAGAGTGAAAVAATAAHAWSPETVSAQPNFPAHTAAA